jgi:hypothetical protein
MKTEQTQCSETSAIKHHMPENNPKGYTRQKDKRQITQQLKHIEYHHDNMHKEWALMATKLKILTLISQYILSLMRFLSSNLDIFTFNSSVHNINTRLGLKLHKPLIKPKMYQQSPYYN